MAWIKQPSNPGEKDMWWNNATNQYTDAAPSDTEQFLGRFAALRPAGYESTGGFDSYIRGLGLSGADLNNALNKAIQTNGWEKFDAETGQSTGQDAALANITRLADQERIKLLGTAFDSLGKDTGWQNLYNADTAAQQQGAVNARNERGQREYEASSGIDWGGIASGLGLVLGAGALGGAFGGSGLFGGANSFPVGGADWMSEIAAGAGNGGAGLGGVGNFVAPEAIGGTGGGSGGGMDWLDELINSTGSDWNTGGLTGADSAVINGSGLPIETMTNPNIGADFGELSAEIGQAGQGSASNTASLGQQLQRLLSTGQNVPTSLIKSLFGTSDTGAASLAKLFGTGLGGLLDYKASTNQADALKAIADRSWAAGQPYRDRANAAMTPGFDIKSIPGLSSAMDTATETYLRKLSATNGNPAGIGAAPSQTEAFVLGNVALPAWQNYFNANSNAGGLSNLSAQSNATATQAAGADAATYGSLGTTANKLLNPQQDQTSRYLDILSKAYGLA